MEPLGRVITVALALAAAFAAAAWVAGAIWAHYDIGRRTQDLYIRMFATLMVLLLGPIGAVLYLILRPRETLDEAYLRALQEEVLLQEMQPAPAAEAAASLLAINGRAPTIGRGAFVAPGAKLIGDVRLGDGASVWYNTVIRADIAPVIIGAGTNIQDGCVLHVDPGGPLRIGANVTVGHMAVLHACTIEDECLIGIQSTVLSGAHVARHSIVGGSRARAGDEGISRGVAAHWRAGATGAPGHRAGSPTPDHRAGGRIPRTGGRRARRRPQHRGGLTRRMPAAPDDPRPGYSVRIRDMAAGSRPRERLDQEGPAALSDAELLAIILRVGSARGSAVELGQSLLAAMGGLAALADASVAELCAHHGIGRAKAVQIKAALELARRLQREPAEARPEIRSPDDAARILAPRIAALPRETLQVVLLDGRHRVMGVSQIAEGRVNTVGARMAEVFSRRRAPGLPGRDPGAQPSVGRPGAFRGRHQSSRARPPKPARSSASRCSTIW